MRQEFTANVSHELKTPLTLHFRLCGNDRNRPCQTGRHPRLCGKILESQRLLELIGDIMKLSELDEGKKISFERIDLAQVVQETKARLQLQSQKAQSLYCNGGETAPVNGNLKLLNELAFNLCDNAYPV